MKTFNRSFVSGIVVAVSLLFVSNVTEAEAACSVAAGQASYENGDTVSVTAVNDSGGDWAVCIYSGGKLNGGGNLPVGSSVTGTDTTKTATAVVNTSTDNSGWKAVVVSGNGCNSAYNAGSVLCESSVDVAGTAAPTPAPTAAAATPTSASTAAPTPTPTPAPTAATTPTSASTFPSTTITNPLSTDDFTVLVTNFLQWLLGIAGSIALLMLIYGGVVFISSTGDQQKMESGKRIVTWTLFGLMIILVSFSIVQVVEKIFVTP